jgi:pimeloyl-ACP methyl ester carboxylesterase
MARLEMHFFHGFLGEASDWEALIRHLPKNRFEIKTHQLLQDIESLEGPFSFTHWANYKKDQLQSSPHPKILVGYSMGGRLLMHLPPTCFEKAFLLASHPGLELGKEERVLQDSVWAQKLETQSPDEWLRLWNEQKVFSSDRHRPQRNWDLATMKSQIRVLQAFSLGKQDMRDSFLSEHSSQYYWACGSLDSKFSLLKKRMEKILGASRVCLIPEAGHGLPFDAPEALAQWIVREVESA